MTISPEILDVELEIVEFVRLGYQHEAEFLVEAINLPTLHAMLTVVGRWKHFDPARCRDTIGDLFTYAERLRLGYVAIDTENTAPIIDAELPWWDPAGSQEVGFRRELTSAELVRLAERWIAWGCEMGAVVTVRQKYDGSLCNEPGRDPDGIRLAWT